MPREARPHRILLLRSGRHLRVAMDGLAARSPGCHIGVVGTPGSQPAIQQAGIAAEDAFFYAESRFQPASFFFSATAWATRRWQYDQVAILWNDPDGQGQGNVDRTALAMSPRGYLAITPDGTIVERALWPQVRTEGARLIVSLVVGAFLGMFLYGPALVMKAVRSVLPRRRTAPHKGAPYEAGDTAPREGAPYEGGRRAGLYGPPQAPREDSPHGATTPRSVVVPFKRPEAQR